jgi:hypothetical protein
LKKLDKERLLSLPYIERTKEKDALKLVSSDLIKVILGPRRAGKSVFALMLLKDQSFAYFNFDDESLPGEEGKMSLIWSASSGDFARSGVKFSYPPSVSLKAEINNENGRPCISPIEQPLVRDPKAPETVINFSSKTTCRNPKVIASIIGGGGKVLDSKEFVFKTSGEDKDSKPLGKMATVIIVAVLLIAVGVYLKKKNTSRVAM